MSLIDDLTPDLAAINAALSDDFGTKVSIYRVVQTARADNSKAKAYTADATLVEIAADVLDPVAAARRQAFGLTAKAQLLLLFATMDGLLPAINIGDGVKFTSGPYIGRKFLADNAGAPDAQGITLGVSLIEAPAGTVMA